MIKLKNIILENVKKEPAVIGLDMDGVLCDFEKQFDKLLQVDTLWNVAINNKNAISNKKLADIGITKEQFIKRSGELRQEVLRGEGDKIEVLKKKFKSEFNAHPPSWTMIGMAGVDFWASMEWMSGGKELVNYVESLPTPKIVITAGAGVSVKTGKMKWLATHGMSQYATEDKFNIVNAGREKGKLAKPGILLIDDKAENISVFKENGGMGIVHINTSDTINQLKTYYAQSSRG